MLQPFDIKQCMKDRAGQSFWFLFLFTGSVCAVTKLNKRWNDTNPKKKVIYIVQVMEYTLFCALWKWGFILLIYPFSLGLLHRYRQIASEEILEGYEQNDR